MDIRGSMCFAGGVKQGDVKKKKRERKDQSENKVISKFIIDLVK